MELTEVWRLLGVYLVISKRLPLSALGVLLLLYGVVQGHHLRVLPPGKKLNYNFIAKQWPSIKIIANFSVFVLHYSTCNNNLAIPDHPSPGDSVYCHIDWHPWLLAFRSIWRISHLDSRPYYCFFSTKSSKTKKVSVKLCTLNTTEATV